MKRTTIFLICSMFISFLSLGQAPTTELFETESHQSTSFSDNDVTFNIISHNGLFRNYTATSQWGWSGTGGDYRFVDNSGSIATTSSPSFSIKTTSNLFKVSRFWIFCGDLNTNPNTTGTLTVTGKLSGVIKFSNTKTADFAGSPGATNGYTLIDLTSFQSQNYSNIVIDELVITGGGNFRYLGLDAFTWVKDTNLVLAASEVKKDKTNHDIYPNPTSGPLTINTEKSGKFEIYSLSGSLLKTIEAQKGENRTDISGFPDGVYILKSETSSQKIIKK